VPCIAEAQSPVTCCRRPVKLRVTSYVFCGGKFVRGCFIIALSISFLLPAFPWAFLTASELCGKHEHPVGSSVEVSDSAIDWNVDEQMNFNDGVFECCCAPFSLLKDVAPILKVL
jgi:hypothetical protein